MVFQRVVSSFKESTVASREQRDHRDALRRFGQYKLLFGLTNNMNGPAKHIYDAALSTL